MPQVASPSHSTTCYGQEVIDLDETKRDLQAWLIHLLEEYRAYNDTTMYVGAWRDYVGSLIRGALEARGTKTSETLAPGWKIGISPRKLLVCACHDSVLYECPYLKGHKPEIDGEYLTLSMRWKYDGTNYLFVTQKGADDETG
jgi:hypothetical protein